MLTNQNLKSHITFNKQFINVILCHYFKILNTNKCTKYSKNILKFVYYFYLFHATLGLLFFTRLKKKTQKKKNYN